MHRSLSPEPYIHVEVPMTVVNMGSDPPVSLSQKPSKEQMEMRERCDHGGNGRK